MRQGSHLVLDRVCMKIEPGEKVGILGRNGAGKSTLIRLLSGADMPTSGSITRTMRVSWPLALTGGFQGGLTGYDNFRFICRIYDVEYEPVKPFIEEFTELGKFLNEPVKNYSSGMKARLAFAISMAIEFDCYLIDETLAVGDNRFREKCHQELFVKRCDRSLVVVSHQPETIKTQCNNFYALRFGKIEKFKNLESAKIYLNC